MLSPQTFIVLLYRVYPRQLAQTIFGVQKKTLFAPTLHGQWTQISARVGDEKCLVSLAVLLMRLTGTLEYKCLGVGLNTFQMEGDQEINVHFLRLCR